MRRRFRLVGLTAMGVAVVACGSAAAPVSRSGQASRTAPAAARPRVLTCGAAPSARPRLTHLATRTLALPGSPDGVATTPDGQTTFVAIQSGAARVAVVARGRVRTIGLPGYPSGMRVAPDGHTVLAAAGDGAVALDAAGLHETLAVPRRVAGSGPGAAEIAVSPDSRYAFTTLEGAGRVAVFRLSPARFVGSTAVGAGALGITVSPDGRWLFEVSESGAPNGRGRLNVLDLARAEHAPAHALVSTLPVGCAPVRVAVSPDGATVWVTARDANALLGFSAAALRHDPGHALSSITPVGARPLGLAVVDGGRRVLVADSGDRCVSLLDTATTPPRSRGCIPSGDVPDAISAPAAGPQALVTLSNSHALQLIPLRGLP